MQGRQSLLTFLTVTRWSRSTSNFYVLIDQNLTGEFMRKIYAASGNLLTDNWSWQSFMSSCDVLNCLFLLNAQNEISCYQDCSVIHGWFVHCAFCWQMHSLSKSLEIRFRMASFSKLSLYYSLALAWGVQGLKSLKRFWRTWWPSEAASWLVSLSNYCLWCFIFFRFPEVERTVYPD